MKTKHCNYIAKTKQNLASTKLEKMGDSNSVPSIAKIFDGDKKEVKLKYCHGLKNR